MSDTKKEPAVSPDIARALLDANPDLRAKGISTNLLITEAAKLPDSPEQEVARKSAPLLIELKVLKQQFSDAAAKIADERARLLTQERELRTKIATPAL